MLGVKQTRSLLGPADPARFVAVPPAPVPAAELIGRAEAAPEVQPGPVRPRHRSAPRRRVLVAVAAGAAFAVAAVVAYPLAGSSPEAPPSRPPVALPLVVVPIAYQETTDPEPAADYLRGLAAQITDASYDGGSGEHTYHRVRTWGAVTQTSPEGHSMSYVEERETWAAADGSGRQRDVTLGAQFPDEESRRYYEAVPDPDLLVFPQAEVREFRAGMLHADAPMPTSRQQLAELFGVTGGGEPDFKAIQDLYGEWAVPTAERAAALEVLAEVPGFVWRGEVTDRAERSGVAVSYDQGQLRWVLVFDPNTGQLLSSEHVDLEDQYLDFYGLYLETGWTDERGPEPTGGRSPEPTNEPSPEPTNEPSPEPTY